MVVSSVSKELQFTILIIVFSVHTPTNLLFYILLSLTYYFSFFG
jgi:hypothetical protein